MSGEPVRKCMYCDEEHLARGMNRHVSLKSDDRHGERDDVPDDYDIEKCEVVGSQQVDIDREKEKPDHSRYICHYCGDVRKGKRALGVHLARDDEHPVDPDDEIDYDEFPVLPASENNIVWVPHAAYIPLVQLDDEEKKDGWTVEIDPSLNLDLSVDGDSVIPSKGVALHLLKQESLAYLEQDRKIAPLEAYRMAAGLIERLPEGDYD